MSLRKLRSSGLSIFLFPALLAAQTDSPLADSLRSVTRNGPDSSKVYAYAALSDDFEIHEDVEKAGRLLDTAETIQKRLPEGDWTIRLLLARGYYFQKVSQYQASLDVYLKAAGLSERKNNFKFMAQSNYGIASVMYEQERYPEAIKYQEKAVELAQKTTDHSLVSQALCNLAGFYYGDSETSDKVTPTMQEALRFAYLADSSSAKIVLINLVGLLTDQKKTKEAREHLAQFKYLLTRGTEANEKALAIFLEGLILQKEGSHREAIPFFQKALAAFKNVGSVPRIKSVYGALKKSLVEVGDYKGAFEAQLSFQNLQDSVFKAEQFRSVSEMQTKYETEKKEAQIAAQQQEIARSNREKMALAGGLALFGLLSFLLFRQRQRTKAANLELVASNAEISRQNQKLDLLMRELHHRVKNNLQLVGSLLRLQGRRVQDTGAAGAIREGQLRVEAMSLIHQRLYRTEGLTTVDMNDFAAELCEKIALSFGFQPDAFDAAIRFSPGELDVEQAMPIGLILNELITNSFKYAFEKTPRPGLKISLEKHGEGKLRLHYADNGAGKSEEAKSSFGTQLIQSLSGQLEGESRYWNAGGLHFELDFHG